MVENMKETNQRGGLLMEIKMRKEIEKIICKAVCTAAKGLTEKNVNSTCIILSYQPELPKEAEKLRKYE